ncbi:hypothetical protein BaRGS_00013073, partial [Batillaria attramentaria]
MAIGTSPLQTLDGIGSGEGDKLGSSFTTGSLTQNGTVALSVGRRQKSSTPENVRPRPSLDSCGAWCGGHTLHVAVDLPSTTLYKHAIPLPSYTVTQ